MQNKDKISDLYKHLGYWHNRFGQQVHLGFERRLKAHDVTVSQWCIMVTLYHEYGDTVRELAKTLSLDAGAVTRLADRLEDKKILIRLPEERDARSVKFKLTQKGELLVLKLAEEADKNDEQFYGCLNDQELLAYQQLLTKLLDAGGTDVLNLCRDFCIKPQIKEKKEKL
jgi:MarR family transcriptional regulator, organic hydroperoxide resistance regulator